MWIILIFQRVFGDRQRTKRGLLGSPHCPSLAYPSRKQSLRIFQGWLLS